MDVTLVELWLPILVSTVFVFIASAILWMAMPHHKADIRVLPDDKASTIPSQTDGLEPGIYMWPNCSDSKEMKSEEFKKKWNEGPWGTMTVLPGRPNMGRNMALGFVVYLLIGVFVAYLTSLAHPAGAEYLPVFRVAGASAIAIYALGWMPNAIWFGKPARFWCTDLIDNIVYGLLTAGVFAWLWPPAASVLNGAGTVAP